MLFTFPEDARWNAERQAVEFGVEIAEYRGLIRVPLRGFQRLLPVRPTPERCVEACYLQRTWFESVVERRLGWGGGRCRGIGTWRSGGETCAKWQKADVHQVSPRPP